MRESILYKVVNNMSHSELYETIQIGMVFAFFAFIIWMKYGRKK